MTKSVGIKLDLQSKGGFNITHFPYIYKKQEAIVTSIWYSTCVYVY